MAGRIAINGAGFNSQSGRCSCPALGGWRSQQLFSAKPEAGGGGRAWMGDAGFPSAVSPAWLGEPWLHAASRVACSAIPRLQPWAGGPCGGMRRISPLPCLDSPPVYHTLWNCRKSRTPGVSPGGAGDFLFGKRILAGPGCAANRPPKSRLSTRGRLLQSPTRDTRDTRLTTKQQA